MENAFTCGAVDYAASFIKCLFNGISVTAEDSFVRTADSGMNRRFYSRVSCMTSCVFSIVFMLDLICGNGFTSLIYKNTRRNFTICHRKNQ